MILSDKGGGSKGPINDDVINGQPLTSKGGVLTFTFTDIFSVLLELEGLPQKRNKEEKRQGWNWRKRGGWEQYGNLLEGKASEMEQIIDNNELDIDEVIKKWDKLQDSVKYKAFGVTKNKNKTKSSMVNKSTKFNNDKEEARDLLKRSTEQMVKDILEVKDGGQGRCVFFNSQPLCGLNAFIT